ncbi:uncharacterized protein GIQ15_04794 [Arthroderma uncinatum]|uniref:uncharacterized protein n=1 Tax=Arthroderma uncinatum TaxID=74035 RepID=UPI00144A6337|nr:uncharacterized protein GIQ15_04794 [Arthroderma uncinatum]KAF3482035.1 hypothetical protein GIQ15_04794 [Arthroderma uncinatum]
MLLKKAILIPLTLCLAPFTQALSKDADLAITHTKELTASFQAVDTAFNNWGGNFIALLKPVNSLRNLHTAYTTATADANKAPQYTKEESGLIVKSMETVASSGDKANESLLKKLQWVRVAKLGFIADALLEVFKKEIMRYLDAMAPKLDSDYAADIQKFKSAADSSFQKISDGLSG